MTSMADFEFAKPCVALGGCDQAAVALISKSHTSEGCWGMEVYMCQHHLVMMLRSYGDWLATTDDCLACHKPIIGGITQNTRIVRL